VKFGCSAGSLRMKKKIPKWINKEFVAAWASVVMLVVLVVWLWPRPSSPVPANIKHQINFRVIYPKKYPIDTNSWKYLSSEKTLSFNAVINNNSVTITEQKAPLAYQNDKAAYNRFIGSLRPSANFDSPLGSVALTNFVTASDYQTVGATGILNAKGTMLLAHPTNNISEDDWRNLFNSMKVGD
jgi:hypothetical protein